MALSLDACLNMQVPRPVHMVEPDYEDEDELLDDDDLAPRRHANHSGGGACKGPGKQCVECGATQTPQWREGPAGPKTLCNACGVRYNRMRSSKRNGGSSGGSGGSGQRLQGARNKVG